MESVSVEDLLKKLDGVDAEVEILDDPEHGQTYKIGTLMIHVVDCASCALCQSKTVPVGPPEPTDAATVSSSSTGSLESTDTDEVTFLCEELAPAYGKKGGLGKYTALKIPGILEDMDLSVKSEESLLPELNTTDENDSSNGVTLIPGLSHLEFDITLISKAINSLTQGAMDWSNSSDALNLPPPAKQAKLDIGGGGGVSCGQIFGLPVVQGQTNWEPSRNIESSNGVYPSKTESPMDMTGNVRSVLAHGDTDMRLVPASSSNNEIIQTNPLYPTIPYPQISPPEIQSFELSDPQRPPEAQLPWNADAQLNSQPSGVWGSSADSRSPFLSPNVESRPPYRPPCWVPGSSTPTPIMLNHVPRPRVPPLMGIRVRPPKSRMSQDCRTMKPHSGSWKYF